MRPTPTIAAAALLALVVTGCGGGSSNAGASTGCGPILREALDKQFLVHVLGNAAIRYTSDPPTSGPHQPSPPVSGVQSAPIPKPIQVGILEAGDILIQHRTGLPAAQEQALEALAGPHVVVAPATELPAPIVATAWVYKRTCSTADATALTAFVHARSGKGPGSTPSS